MRWVLLFFALLPLQRLDQLPLTPITFDGKELKEAFDGKAENPRLVIVFSPT